MCRCTRNFWPVSFEASKVIKKQSRREISREINNRPITRVLKNERKPMIGAVENLNQFERVDQKLKGQNKTGVYIMAVESESESKLESQYFDRIRSHEK